MNTKTETPDAYRLPVQLLQAIVSTLGELPARQVRALLNAIEAECLRQDEARAGQTQAAQAAAVRGQLEAQGWQAPAVVQAQAPEPPRPEPDGARA